MISWHVISVKSAGVKHGSDLPKEYSPNITPVKAPPKGGDLENTSACINDLSSIMPLDSSPNVYPVSFACILKVIGPGEVRGREDSYPTC